MFTVSTEFNGSAADHRPEEGLPQGHGDNRDDPRHKHLAHRGHSAPNNKDNINRYCYYSIGSSDSVSTEISTGSPVTGTAQNEYGAPGSVGRPCPESHSRYRGSRPGR